MISVLVAVAFVAVATCVILWCLDDEVWKG